MVALREGASATPRELMQHCRERLAAYKVPRAIEIVPALPKTVTGKVAKAAVRQEALGRLDAAAG
jgi:long-chain acyl-CoA synthetase